MRIEVDHTVVAEAGNGVAASAKRVGDDLDRLRGALDALGAPWGGDELSGPFGSQYGALANQALTAISSYRDQLGYAAGELTAAAQTLRDHQEDGADRLRQAWRPPVGQ
jgi:uncharacterized protein YukE